MYNITGNDKILSYDVEMYEEEYDYFGELEKCWFLRVEVIHENRNGKYKTILPKVKLTIDPSSIPFINRPWGGFDDECTTNLGFGELPLRKDPKLNTSVIMEVIEEKKRAMTLEDIEKELGYPVELVTASERKTAKPDDEYPLNEFAEALLSGDWKIPTESMDESHRIFSMVKSAFEVNGNVRVRDVIDIVGTERLDGLEYGPKCYDYVGWRDTELIAVVTESDPLKNIGEGKNFYVRFPKAVILKEENKCRSN